MYGCRKPGEFEVQYTALAIVRMLSPEFNRIHRSVSRAGEFLHDNGSDNRPGPAPGSARTGFINPRDRAGPKCEPREARGALRLAAGSLRANPERSRGRAWRTRRRVRERRVPRLRSGLVLSEVEARVTTRGDADRPSPWSDTWLRRQRAICGVAPPRSTTEGPPSSSLLASGPLALATRFARMYETGSKHINNEGTARMHTRHVAPWDKPALPVWQRAIPNSQFRIPNFAMAPPRAAPHCARQAPVLQSRLFFTAC